MSDIIQIQNQSQGYLYSIRHIRVTSLVQFELCPKKWAHDNFNNKNKDILGEKTDSVYASIGTKAHEIIEKFIKYTFDNKDNSIDEFMLTDDFLNSLSKIPEEEQQNLVDYLLRILGGDIDGQRIDKLLELESEFELSLTDGMPLIQGHIDAVFKLQNDDILILDHKTHRAKPMSNYWMTNLQPLLYTYAIRKKYPEAKRIFFRIGYINHSSDLTWLTDSDDDIKLERRIKNIWSRMEEYAAKNKWAETLSDNCKYCKIRNECKELTLVQSNLRNTFLMRTFQESNVGKLFWIRSVRKIAEKIEEEILEQIKYEHEKGELDIKDYSVNIQFARRREIKPSKLLKVFDDNDIHLSDVIDEIMTVKIGGIEKSKRLKGLKSELEEIIEIKQSENPTIKVMPLNQEIVRFIEDNDVETKD